MSNKIKRSVVIVICIVAFFFTVLITWRHSNNKDLSKANETKIIDSLKNMKGYETDIELEVLNGRQNIKYSGKQKYLKNIGKEINLGENRIFTYDKDSIHVNDKANMKKYDLPENFDEILNQLGVEKFCEFLDSSSQVVISNKELDNKEYLAIDLLLPGYNKNIYRGIMYIDSESGIPNQYHILDEKGTIRIRCNYKKFLNKEKIENFEIK